LSGSQLGFSIDSRSCQTPGASPAKPGDLLFSLATAPLLLLPSAALIYTHLNMKRIFVPHLGCGCAPFFNTNHLSLTICSLLLAGTGISWWIASRGLNWGWRALGAIGLLGWGVIFFRAFISHNMWA
jgi:hypothetical protein